MEPKLYPLKRKAIKPIPIGQVFGRLVVVAGPFSLGPEGRWNNAYRCKCICGAEKVVRKDQLRGGQVLSCNCLRDDRRTEVNTTHGGCGSRLYKIWMGMKERCRSSKGLKFQHYGSRGITVCEEWSSDFIPFRDWSLANGYRDDLEIDRRNNDGGYEPGNCRWVTRSVNMFNRRPKRPVTAFGETKGLGEWAADPRCRVTRFTLAIRLNEGMSTEEALTRPAWNGVRTNKR